MAENPYEYILKTLLFCGCLAWNEVKTQQKKTIRKKF